MPNILVQKNEMEVTYSMHDISTVDISVILSQKKFTLLMKRIYDIIFSALGLLILSPLFVITAILIKLDSPGAVFFKQSRVGKDGKEFQIYKFRKMYSHMCGNGLNLTTANDSRLTKTGTWLMKTKIDELPQAFNVLKGDMAVVGPRPETPNYVTQYTPEQRQVLQVRPGITDYASVRFFNESELLQKAPDPERFYLDVILPQKINLNFEYIKDMSLITDMKIILTTFTCIFIRSD